MAGNRFIKGATLALVIFQTASAQAELTALADDALSSVSGQSGLTLDMNVDLSIDEFAYFDDGNGIAFQGMTLNSIDSVSGADYRVTFDVLNDGGLLIKYATVDAIGTTAADMGVKTNRFEIQDIRFITNPGDVSNHSGKSMGNFFLDYAATGSLEIHGGGALGPDGYTFNSQLSITNGRFGYRTNGNEVFLDDMSLDLNAPGMTLDVVGGVLNWGIPSLTGELNVGAIRYSNNPLNHGVSNDVTSGLPLASYGALWAKFDLSTDIQLKAGGRYGVNGITVDAQTTLNRLDFAWGDDGYWLGLLGMTGNFDLQNLTIDVAPDPEGQMGLAFSYDRYFGNLHVQDIVLGETKANMDAYVLNGTTPVKSIGGVDINFDFQDQIVDGKTYSNIFYMQAGGQADAGDQGLRFDTQWSLISPNNESNFTYTEDGNSIMFSGLKAWGDGDVTLNVTKAGNINGTDFYDGLRIGFENLHVGYQVDGFRVAKSSSDVKSQERQAATTVKGLFGQNVAPAFEGDLNGHVTIGAGGQSGDGLTINSDIVVSNGTMANYIDDAGKGLWLSGLNYDMHLRDMTVDVTTDGLSIVQGESWSTMDIGDFRLGDKSTGSSFGRVVLQKYEQGSTVLVKAGGAGDICVGGNGADQTLCEGDGGRWEARGNQGITIETASYFKSAVSATKRNRLTWETNRQTDTGGNPVNGTGMQLVFDDFTTNDGVDGVDTYGFRTDYNIDVAQTKVVKKSTGVDSNGVFGNKGDEKIMDSTATAGYRYVSAPTAADLTDRPVGLAVQTRTHFKELSFGSVDLVHPSGGSSTLLYGLKLQNVDMTTNLTATPLD